MRYHAVGGKVYTGLTRCVWELNPVGLKDGGTRFIPGSHRAHFEVPAEMLEPENGFLEAYSCPPGSCVVFTESLYVSCTPLSSASSCARALLCVCRKKKTLANVLPQKTPPS